jgi:hypothetical protein
MKKSLKTSDIFAGSFIISLKKRKPVQTPAPFMNKTLRKEIYKKRMFHNKFLKNRSKVNWENYRKQRNHFNIFFMIKVFIASISNIISIYFWYPAFDLG